MAIFLCIQRHLRRNSGLLLLATLALGSMLGLLPLSHAAAAANTVVTPNNPDGWAPANVRLNAAVGITSAQGRGDAPNNLGSLEFTTNTIVNGQDKADYVKYWGVQSGRTLGNLSALSYELYRASSSSTGQHYVPALRLVYSTNETTPKTGYLIWENVYNGGSVNTAVPTDQWLAKDIIAGNFWMRTFNPGFTVEQYSVTLAQWQSGVTFVGSHPLGPDTNIIGIEVGVGSGWGSTFTGYVDNVAASFGSDSITANFEPNPIVVQCTTDCYVDDDSGNDANGGTSFADAKKTIQAGVNQVSSGGTVHVNDGVYDEAITVGKPLTLEGIKHGVLAKGRPGPEAIIRLSADGPTPLSINASNVTVNGFTFDMIEARTPWAITALSQPSYSNLKIQYNVFQGNPNTGNANLDAGGMYMTSQQSLLIEGNYFNDLGSHAVFMGNTSDGTVYRNNDSFSTNLSNFSTHVGVPAKHSNVLIENNRAIDDDMILFQIDGGIIRNNQLTSVALPSRVFLGGGDTNISVTQNTFTNPASTAVVVTPAGYGPNSTISVTNNTITLAVGSPTDSFSLIDLRDANGTNLIDSNKITLSGSYGIAGRATYGIGVRGSGTGTVTITNNELNGGSVASSAALPTSGVVIRSNTPTNGPLTANTSINIANNIIKNFANGVAVYDFVASTYGGLANGVTLTVNKNSITGNSANGLITGANDPLLNAENNWWGSNSGPMAVGNPTGTGDKATGNVDYNPWLCNGTDDQPATTGFQTSSSSSPCVVPPTGPAPAQPGKIYAIANGNPDKGKSQFYTIQNNIATALGAPHSLDFEDIAIHPTTGAIYASTGGDGTNKGYIYRVDGITGAATLVGPSNFKDGIMVLKFRASDNTLWGWSEDKGLVQINQTTGAGTLVYKKDMKIEGMAWALDGKLYMVRDKMLYQYDPTSGKTKDYASNLPKGSESLDIKADGTLVGGAYDKKVTTFTYNIGTKTVTSGPTVVTTTYKSIEGLAVPRS